MDIKIKCKGVENLPLNTLIEFQKGLKKLSPKSFGAMRSSIINNGFIAPIFIWKNGENLSILDGHQRVKVLKSLEKEGYEIPKLPVAYIEADNEKDAKKKLLLITSQYGEFDVSEVTDWINHIEDDTEKLLRLNEGYIDIDSLINDEEDEPEYFEPSFNPDTSHKEYSEKDLANADKKMEREITQKEVKMVKVLCPNCGEEFEVLGQ